MPLKNGRTSAALQQILVGSIIPPGTIQSFGGGTVPDGWLLCDGSTANRSTYSALFDAIGTAHGSGDGVTTFHLPDLRGRFLRGADDMGTGAAERDPGGRTTANAGGNSTGIGSVQADENKEHRHLNFKNGDAVAANSAVTRLSAIETPYANDNTGANYGSYNIDGVVAEADIGLSGKSGGTETRPQNAASLFIIKV